MSRSGSCARAYCDECGEDFLIAYTGALPPGAPAYRPSLDISCKGRGVCPSCNTKRMVETAAHLVDHIIPQVPVRQWVISLPKRLRYFLRQRRGDTMT
ncbi:MAG: transposase zinc-binding domain-containing protein [Sedimenticola sp.]